MITIRNLSKCYMGKKASATALRGVDLDIPQGQVIGLFGENGAGKSTLMKSILNYIRYNGEILLDGEKITHRNITRISFATVEHSFFPGLTADEHGAFYQQQFPHFREKRFRGLMDFFELPRDKAARSLSTGQQNQLEVILALSQGADYILMDEPFSGNDIFNREDFYKVLVGVLEPTETILLSTHLVEEVSGFLDRVILMHKGEIIGDRLTADLEEEETTVMDYIRKSYSYQASRVAEALETMTEE